MAASGSAPCRKCSTLSDNSGQKKRQWKENEKGTLYCFHFFHTCVSEVHHVSKNCFPFKHLLYTLNLRGRSFFIYKAWRNFKSFFIPREMWVCLFEPINSSADCLAGLSETLTVKNCPRLRLVFRFTVKIENNRQSVDQGSKWRKNVSGKIKNQQCLSP